jgi:SIR2-like domain
LNGFVQFSGVCGELQGRAMRFSPLDAVLTDARKAMAGELAVLLGAGASVVAGIPDSTNMTKAVVRAINADPTSRYNNQAWAMNFVCGQLEAYRTAKKEDYLSGLDIEYVASAVALLGDRDNIEATPFVSSWHPAVEEIDLPLPSYSIEPLVQKALSADADKFEAIAKYAARNQPLPRGLRNQMGSGAKELVRAMEQLINSRTGHNTGRIYQALHRTIIDHVCRCVRIEDAAKTLYLADLVRRSQSQEFLLIGTLNYDRTIEIACASSGVPCITGISEWSETQTFPVVREGVKLLKLHGSADWWYTPRRNQARGQLPADRVIESESAVHGSDPVLIFGRREKLRATGPFLNLLSEWEKGISQADSLLVVGYSFRDEHINETIRRWVNGRENRHLVIVDPFWTPGDRRNEFKSLLERHLAANLAFRDEAEPRYLHVITESADLAFKHLLA